MCLLCYNLRAKKFFHQKPSQLLARAQYTRLFKKQGFHNPICIFVNHCAQGSSQVGKFEMKCLLRVHFWPGIFFIEGTSAGVPTASPQQGNQRRGLMSQYPTTSAQQLIGQIISYKQFLYCQICFFVKQKKDHQ